MFRCSGLLRPLNCVSRRFASSLVLVDHDNKAIKSATLSAVSAAQKIGGDVSVLVAGHNCEPVAQAAAKISGVSKVFYVDQPALEHALPENVSKVILDLQKSKSFSHILGSVSFLAKSALPRVAAILDVNQISEIVDVTSESQFTRLTYAGNAVTAIQSDDAIKVLTLRPSNFPKASEAGGNAQVEKVGGEADAKLSEFVRQEVVKSDRPELTSAKVVVCGGRALKDNATFASLMFPLADKMGAAVGATRAAVDSGYCGNDLQIGQTGKIVSPELYLGFGVSGAIQHQAGMKDSKFIFCVNKDPDAPLVQMANFALVDDLYKVIPDMMKLL